MKVLLSCCIFFFVFSAQAKRAWLLNSEIQPIDFGDIPALKNNPGLKKMLKGIGFIRSKTYLNEDFMRGDREFNGEKHISILDFANDYGIEAMSSPRGKFYTQGSIKAMGNFWKKRMKHTLDRLPIRDLKVIEKKKCLQGMDCVVFQTASKKKLMQLNFLAVSYKELGFGENGSLAKAVKSTDLDISGLNKVLFPYQGELYFMLSGEATYQGRTAKTITTGEKLKSIPKKLLKLGKGFKKVGPEKYLILSAPSKKTAAPNFQELMKQFAPKK